MAKVGKNILDNLTTGMYADSKVIYREYIQNACDQIDLAVKQGLLACKEDGQVVIYLDEKKRYISIHDNATGVPSDVFINDLGDIANSNKVIGENKGFRGIGRLCGLAYCKTLTFTTSSKGESVKSIMTCDAQKMRAMLYESKKYTLDEIWDAIVKFSTKPEDPDKHYFEVELFDINNENTDLLNVPLIREYLSFVAPVPYKNTFFLSSQIYDHAQEIGYVIDEYCIKVNGAQLFKEYTTRLKKEDKSSVKTYDEITKLQPKDFYDENGNLIAWMWYGLSRFEKMIPINNKMRGLRLRSANIQLGNDDSLQGLFKEHRGNYYFVGEVFAVDRRLIPNSQRNYFNENDTRVLFETLLRNYFIEVLHQLYYGANKINNAYKKQENYVSIVAEFEKKRKTGGFVDADEKQRLEVSVATAKKAAEDARKELKKYEGIGDDTPLGEVHKQIQKKFDATKLTKKATKAEIKPDSPTSKKKTSYLTDSLSKLSRKERTMVRTILSIITDVAPKDVAEEIIEKIVEALK